MRSQVILGTLSVALTLYALSGCSKSPPEQSKETANSAATGELDRTVLPIAEPTPGLAWG